MPFTSFRICKTFRVFKITFLKLKENQQLVNTPDFTLNYFLKPQRLKAKLPPPGLQGLHQVSASSEASDLCNGSGTHL